MKLNTYTNFNRQKNRTIASLLVDGTEIGALCRYEHGSYDDFMLPQATFTYVAKGWKRMLAGGREYILHEGDLLYLPKHTVIFSEIPFDGKAFESINLCIPEEAQSAALSNEIRFFQQQRTIPAIFSAMSAANDTGGNSYHLSEEHLQQLISYCRSDNPFSAKKALHPQEQQRLLTAVTEHLYEPMTIPEMAARCYMSPASYKRKFESVFHEAPKTWIRKRKLEKAWFQLRIQKKKIIDICEQVGLENSVHFSQQFKKQFGISPSKIICKKTGVLPSQNSCL